MGNGRAYQILMAVASAAGSLSLGLLYVWPSYTLPMLAASNGTILDAPLTTTEEAMLGALPSLGALVGSALVGMAINTFGRKMANILTTLLYMISWTMIGFTRSITVVLIARFLGGVAGGLTCVITPVYISEVAEDHIRGILASFIVVFYQTGTLTSYFIGWYCSYHAIVWINLAIPIVRILMFLWVPESPVYLMKKNRVENSDSVGILY
ncbi:solute carrier family 2, facilitated glucose transporter member 8-like [Ostrinia furnacalis]|uniref:solute carrier family 2, facilitated glucose transporter member 8-like n=1 Tax=Ostrinia furnacalis TaxID=93504 RepID=UPI00103A5D29|nr:solute carrier family 2, facilitated glucose transporter member 8-like [Ostrinia furnacalis]